MEHVVPVLSDHGFSATVFAVAGRIGGINDWDDGPQRALLGARELIALAAGRMEVGSHGLSHTAMAGMPPEQLLRETVESRSVLKELVGASIDGFCYPYGSFDEAALVAVREAGYEYACAVSPGKWDSRYLIPRAYIGERDGAVRLSAKLVVHRLGLRSPPQTR
jgi:peptidoglycan/xylan/chitin deacetylase (PgdA/CDA1 family)